MGAKLAGRGDLGRAEAVSDSAPTPLLLASTSPQRRAILSQLEIPFNVAAPRYEEKDAAGADPIELVRAHALGKARSLAGEAAGRPVLGVDTAVLLDREVFGKPADDHAYDGVQEAAPAMLVPLLITAGLSVALGVYPDFFINMIKGVFT